MIDRTHELSVSRQCQLLELPRSTAYYRPLPESPENLALMRRIDELHLEFPFAGARMLRDLLRPEGIRAGRKRIAGLMAKMGIEALYRKPNTSKKGSGHKIYPYLLRNLTIDRPNQVWAADITYIPMRRGFVYLVAVVDWFSRKVLSWRISNTLTTDFCLDAVREAIHRYGIPEIFNTDQGSQFTSTDFTTLLKDHGIRISMDGKGCWRDNVFVERLWRSVKYEEVYLYAYDSVSQAKAGLAKYFALYNTRRPHSRFDGIPPDQAYFGNLPEVRTAA
jgi:putative transposase